MSGRGAGSPMPGVWMVGDVGVGTLLTVKAWKTVGGLRRLVNVPSELWFSEVRDYGPIQATQLTIRKPLSTIVDQGWTDDVHVSFASDIGPNTADIIEYIIERWSDLEAGDYSEVRESVDSFPMNFVLLERKNTLEALKEIAWQARCALYLDNGVVKLKYLPVEPDSDDTITTSDIVHQTTVVGLTDTEDLVTKMEIGWRITHADETPERMILRRNIERYGTKPAEFDFYCFNQPDVILHAATFWLIRRSNTWKRIRFQTPLTKLNLELGDCVTLDLPYVANGPVKAIVEEASYDSESNTLSFVCLTCVRAGEMTPYPWFWPADAIKFPSDDSLIPTVGQLPIGYTGVLGVKYRGEYDNGTTYAVGDGVLFNAESYVCVQRSTGNLPSNTTFWQLVSLSGTGTIWVGGPNVVFLFGASGGARFVADSAFTAQSIAPSNITAEVNARPKPKLNLKLNYAAPPIIPTQQTNPAGWPYLLDDTNE